MFTLGLYIKPLFPHLPVIHNEHYDLSNDEEQLCQLGYGLISVVHSWEVNHIQTIYNTIHTVEEWHSGALDGRGAHWDLIK